MEKKHVEISKDILNHIGGKDNVASALHCYTRLRINIKDKSLVDTKALKSLDILGTQFMGNQLQIIIGDSVSEVYEAFVQVSGIENQAMLEEQLDQTDAGKEKFSLNQLFGKVIDGIVGSMIPILPILIASGILKALILILIEFNLIESTSPTAFTLSFVADSTFYFMPVIIAVFAAKKFKANIALAAMLGASLIHPDFIQAVSEGQSLGIFGLDIYPAMYSSSVIPIILSVWVMSYVERFIRKISPKSLRTMFVPVLTMLIMVPLTFVFLAPIGASLSSKFGQFLSWSHNTFGFLAVALLSAFIPWIVMLGMHVGTVPISLSTIEASGADRLIMPAFLISNFTQGAACLAVGIKSKSDDVKALAYSSAFSNIVPGISEPGMYGITLRYKTPMWGAMIGAAVGGLYLGIAQVGSSAFLPPNIFALAGYVGEGLPARNFINVLIGILIGMLVTFVVTMWIYDPSKENEQSEGRI